MWWMEWIKALVVFLAVYGGWALVCKLLIDHSDRKNAGYQARCKAYEEELRRLEERKSK